MKYYANVIIQIEVDFMDDREEAQKEVGSALDDINIGNSDLFKTLYVSEVKTEEEMVKCSLSRRINIKERVKEVYAKLKCLVVDKNVSLYYDLLEAILKL